MVESMDPKTAEKVQQYQSQIKVLLHNYQILQKNELDMPEETVKFNIERVEKLLIKLSRKQSKVTEKWLSSRQKPSLEIAVTDPTSDIKDTLEDQQTPSDNTAPNSPASNATVESPPSGQPSPINEPETQDSPSSLPADDGPSTTGPPDEEEIKSHSGSSSGANSQDGLSMPPPPAITTSTNSSLGRGEGGGPRRGGPGRKGRGGKGKVMSKAVLEQMRRQEAREEAAIAAAAALGLNVSAELVLKPGQFKGDVTPDEVDRTRVLKPDEGHETEYLEVDDAVVPQERTLETVDHGQFMLNIGLLTPEGTDIVCRQRSDERRVKNNWRNLTYVPEISDRKHRVRYTYLSPEMTSPPLLRARSGNGSRSLHQTTLRGVKSRHRHTD